MGTRSARVALASLIAAVMVVVIAVWGVQQMTGTGGAGDAGRPLEKWASLAEEDPAGISPTASSAPAADVVEQFEDVLHVENGQGERISLADVPASEYSGFLVKPAPASAEAGDADAKLASAAEQGLARKVVDGLYSVPSLEALAGLVSADEVSLVEPNYTLHLVGEVDSESPESPEASSATKSNAALLDALGGTDKNPAPDFPPNDQNYAAGKLWHLDMLNVKEAWELGLDGDPYVYNNTPVRDGSVRVAIIDTGFYGTGSQEQPHEDFDYGRVDVGYDWIHADADHAPDAKGHGTFVAGLIGAKVNNNGVGVAGLTPNVTLVPEKVFDTGSATTENVISAIYHAAGYYNDIDPVDVINMSLGGEYNDSSLEEACDYAVEQGVLVVASAGNDGVATPNYPAAYDSVVGVASVDSSKNRSSWSQYGVSVFVTAPGESVTSTYNEGADSYATASGTSFSGPEVAALGAVCKSVYPDIDQDTFKQLLIDTSRPLGGTDQGVWNQNYGYGLVDFGAMGHAVLASQTLPWYNLSFDVTDVSGDAIEDATVTLAAAEDIAWEADSEASPAFGAGSLVAGSVVEPTMPGAWRVHRGVYRYTVSAPGHYLQTGTLRTLSENQKTSVKMPAAYEVTINVVDSQGAAVEGAQLTVSSDARVETPKSQAGNTQIFDLASGVYSYELSADGFATASGTLVVEHAACSVDAVLYRADELASVSFAYKDSESGAAITKGVSLVVADGARLTVNAQDDGTYRLARGKTYTATASKVGYDNASEAFTVNEGGQVVTLSLVPALNRVTFNVTDAGTGAAVTRAKVNMANAAGSQVDPREEGGLVFGVAQGSYTYEVVAPGYESKQGTFEISTSSVTLNVALVAVPQSVTFAVTDSSTGAAISDAAIKVSTTATKATIPATSPGVWQLSPGSYRYTVYKEGYEVAMDAFVVGGEALEVPVALAPRQAGTTQFAGGTGTEDDPYLIATEDQLRYLARSTEIVRMSDSSASTNVRKTLTGYYQLIDDIELTGEWTPIGNEESSSNYFRFGGTFDGAGHTVSNVFIDQPGLEYQGFFGSVVGATIRNLTIEGPGISGRSYVGGLVGRCVYTFSSEYPQYNTDPTSISNCGNSIDVTGKYAVAGIIGSAQATNQDLAGKYYDPGTAGGINIASCFNTGAIEASDAGSFTRGSSAAGGIVGSAQQIVIDDCYNWGSVQSGYNAGGIAGNSRLCSIATSYNTGLVAQYVTAPGYEGTAGGIAGNVYYTVMTDCAFVPREGNTGNARTVCYGSTDSASVYTNCTAKTYEDAYRASAFVSAMNTNTTTGAVGSAFVLGRDFPLLSWQVASGALLAPAPRIVEQPQGISAKDAYKVGEQAAQLVARVEVGAGSAPAGTLTWAWYAADNAKGTGARPVAGATGSGASAACTPSTAEVGARYYFCVFTNSVSTETDHDEAQVRTDAAAIFVRSQTDAQAPVITKLNPSQTTDVNTQVTAKNGTDAALSVTAEVADGGELTYQWYESVSGSATPSAIDGADGPAYDADTTFIGTRYYYVYVTNTLEEGNASTTVSDRIAVNTIPYTIDGYEDLAAFRSEVNGGMSFAGVTVTLTTDVAIPDGVDWEPIGTRDRPFSGSFMGGEGYASSDPEKVVTHTVSNLHVNGDARGNSFLGLFGYTQDAQIFDVCVQGEVTGASNTYAGLLVGYASTYNTSSSYAYIENCVALAGSSVEGKYLIAGVAGANGGSMNNCANHADVHARAFAREATTSTSGLWSVGGVVGFSSGSGELMGCYNTGLVTVEPMDSDTYCAEYVGGVVAYTGAHSGVFSSFNAGQVTVGTKAPSPLTYRGRVRYGGAVAGYVSYASSRGRNLHYLEGTYEKGANDDTATDWADLHSMAFMKTDYFLNMLANGYEGYSKSHFARSADGVPHYAWEPENIDSTSDGKLHSAEPWLIDVQSKDMPKITSTWKGVYFVGGAANPIYVLAESPDGGTLTFRWQKREADESYGFDDGWEDIPGAAEFVSDAIYNGRIYQAGVFTIPRDSAADAGQYRCVVTNALAGAEDASAVESATNPITIEMRDPSEGIFLKDPNGENSKDNPWIVDTPTRLRFLGDVVNGTELLPGLDDSTFAGQYIAMTADIDISEFYNWTPIGTYGDLDKSKCFAGTFDGCDHAITGLRIDRQGTNVLDNAPWYPTDYTGVGLFGGVYLATIRNLEVAGSVYLDNWRYTSTTTQAWMTGGVAGAAWGTYFENVTNRASVAGYQDVGGIVGNANNCRLFNCENLGTVTVNESAPKSSYMGVCVGGIVGNLVQTSAGAGSGAGAFNCYNGGSVLGRVTQDGDYRFGAVIGEVSGAPRVANNAYAQGSVGFIEGVSGRAPTGIGGGNNGRAPKADETGVVQAVAAGKLLEGAWKLNTAGVGDLGVSSGHSAKWGVFTRADLGEGSDAVHLVHGDSSKAVYRLDTSSASAVIVADPAYARAGENVAVTWESKVGFSVKSIGWKQAGEGDSAATPLGTGESGAAQIAMPAADVEFVVESERDTTHRFGISARTLLDGADAPASVGTVSFDQASVPGGTTVRATIAPGAGYQVKSVAAADAYGVDVSVAKVSGLAYDVEMAFADVVVTVEFEPVGALADGRAASLAVQSASTHRFATSSEYATANLLYETIAFSGTYFGVERPIMTYEMEASGNPGLYTQRYTFADGTAKTFTGVDAAAYIHALGDSEPAASTPVTIELRDGSVHRFTYGDLSPLAYSSYDSDGQPDVRGLPVLLGFGCDGVPNGADGSGTVSLVFGQKASSDDNASKMLAGVARVCVGDDVNYSMHEWSYGSGSNKVDYSDMDLIAGGTADAETGQTTLHVRTYRGDAETGVLLSDKKITLPQIEAMARKDTAGIQRGYYSTYLYEEREEASDGPYTDYYEGYDLYKVLESLGVKYVPEARVQFYQSGLRGLESSWKTVNVSLGYLAGNGAAGKGDYSGNVMRYAGDGNPASGTLSGVHPMIVYGKNGLPLVWGSGTRGVDPEKYNYRGPLMAFLPMNAKEGGAHVGSQTSTSCYLGLIDIYLPEDYEANVQVAKPSEAGGSFVYSGKSQRAVEADKRLVLSGDVSKVDAGDYVTTVAPAEGCEWEDGTTSPVKVKWSIARAQVAKPSARAGLVYTGRPQTGVAAGEGYAVTGGAATAAGAHTATATLDANHAWKGGATSPAQVEWSIARAQVAKPSARAGLVYTGRPQTGVAAGEGYAVTGGAATAAGAHTATATLDANHAWKGGSVQPISVTWKIAKAASAITGVKATYKKKYGAAPFSLGSNVTSGAVLKYASSNTNVAKVSAAGKVTIVGAGSARIAISGSASANYEASSKSVTLTVSKAAQPMKVAAKAKTVKQSQVKKKKKVLSGCFKFKKKAQGKVTYQLASKSKWLSVNKSTGKITVKKGAPAKKYSIKVKVKAAGTRNYKSGSVTVKVKVTVKKTTARGKKLVGASTSPAV